MDQSNIVSAPERPLTVLHVVGSLGAGGIETWLMHVFSATDAKRVRHEVLVEKPGEAFHDQDAQRLGVVLHKPRRRGSRVDFLMRLNRLLASQRYQVVHSHCYLFSGLVLAVARLQRVPIRVAHCHQAKITQGSTTPQLRAKQVVLRPFLDRFATRLLGISGDAMEEIAGTGWRKRNDAEVLLYGFDFSKFKTPERRSENIRAKLRIDPITAVIGHVGRFVYQKNHHLLIESFAELSKLVSNVCLVLVGEGPLEAEVRDQVERLGLSNRVYFAGLSKDIPGYMAAFDLFVLPSRHEGLGIVAVEAQAAGTRCVYSDVVPPEADIVADLVTRLPLSAHPHEWAQVMERELSRPRPDRAACFREVETSKFNISRCVARLEEIYRGADG